MKVLPQPSFTISEVIRECVSNIRDVEKAKKYCEAIELIEEYSSNYILQMSDISSFDLRRHDSVTDAIKGNDMVWLYDNKFVRKGQPGRKYYDKLILSAPGETCPYCGVGKVRTIDHYLPKASFPKLSLTPQNLIPSCRDCNEEKGTVAFCCGDECIIHPYFDSLDEIEWLKARIHRRGSCIVFKYYINDDIPIILAKRLHKHMETFDLYSRFSICASNAFGGIKTRLGKLYHDFGEAGLKRNLELDYFSEKTNDSNSWRTAMFFALMNINDYKDILPQSTTA